MSAHTPGPWSFSPRTLIISYTDLDAIGQPTKGVAAVFGTVGGDGVNATGKVIAEAPAVLAALESVLADWSKLTNVDSTAVCKARAVVARARGQL